MPLSLQCAGAESILKVAGSRGRECQRRISAHKRRDGCSIYPESVGIQLGGGRKAEVERCGRAIRDEKTWVESSSSVRARGDSASGPRLRKNHSL